MVREREREIYPNMQLGQHVSSTWGTGTQVFGPSSAPVLGAFTGSWMGSGSRTQLRHLGKVCGHSKWWLNPL